MRLANLLDLSVLQSLAEANFKANGMPIGIVDALDGAILVGAGWQDVCIQFHRANALTLERCRESDAHIASHLTDDGPCEYLCRNGLRDIAIPIRVDGRHLATLFLGQFFYEGEAPDRQFFVNQARQFAFDERSYLAAVDRVPVFTRETVKNILEYDQALARFIAGVGEAFHRRMQTERQLSAAVHARDVFLSAASHELKTPLTSLDLIVESLERQIASGKIGRVEEVAAKLPVIRRQSSRLARLIRDMLEVWRLEDGRPRLQAQEVDLCEVVIEVLDRFTSEIQASGSEITLHGAAGVTGQWDPVRIDQVVTNLVSNAVKYGAGNPIVITATATEAFASLDVTDHGIGIAPENLEKVFERFERTHSIDSYGGLGLGLWVARQYVHAHSGTIEVRSEPGAGSTFSVTLPRTPTPVGDLSPRSSGA